MKTRTRTTDIALAVVSMALGVALIRQGASADQPAAPAPTAQALLQRSAATLQAASSIQADFEEIDSYPGQYKDLAQRGTLSLVRPGEFRIDIRRFRRVNASQPWTPSGNDAISVDNGSVYTYAFLHPHSTQIHTEPSTEKIIRTALKPASPLAGFFSNVAAPADASFRPPETWEGASYQVVEYSIDGRDDRTVDARAWIGGDDLVHRLVYTSETEDGIVTREWNLRNIRVNADISSSTFAYAPPADATPLDTSNRAPLLAAGDPAPDFALVDARGKTVHLSDFRGKTVVLDFWATWCWPCNQSLPHTDSVVADDGDNNVVALAVAIWDSKTGFDAWIGKHNYPHIDFAFDPNPQGKDVGSALYHVSATPTAYVIGPDGKVVKAIAGYTGPDNQLKAAIQSASSVKSADSVNP